MTSASVRRSVHLPLALLEAFWDFQEKGLAGSLTLSGYIRSLIETDLCKNQSKNKPARQSRSIKASSRCSLS